MKFVCERCQTKYSIADERVRGKILKVKCKTCANVITVREERRPSAPQSTLSRPGSASHPTVARPPTAPQPAVGVEPSDSVERTVLAPAPALFDAAPPPTPRRQSASMAAVGAPDDGIAWYLALSGERSGPFSRKQLVDKLVALPRNADLHVWNDQLGSWKPPADVPAVAADLASRRRVPPPPPSGAPRRPVVPPPVASINAPLRASSLGAKLPPPTGGTRPRPTLSSLAAAAAPARASDAEPGVDIDPSTLLETPAPQAGMLHAFGSNGHGAAAGNGVAHASSDGGKLLNLSGGSEGGQGASAARLMTAADAVGWSPSGDLPVGRGRNTKLFVGLLAVVGVIVVVFIIGLSGKKAPPPPVAAKVAPATDPMAGMLEKMAQEPPPPPKPAPPPVQPAPVAAPAPARGKARLGGKGRGRPAAAVASAAASSSAPADSTAARYANEGGIKVAPLAAATRPPPSQAQLTAVVNNNRGAIRTCYQRALARDNSLTHGKLVVKLTLGISGRVKGSRVEGPPQFRTIEPCIREVVSRWVFPQASDEYDFEFPLVFQGNE